MSVPTKDKKGYQNQFGNGRFMILKQEKFVSMSKLLLLKLCTHNMKLILMHPHKKLILSLQMRQLRHPHMSLSGIEQMFDFQVFKSANLASDTFDIKTSTDCVFGNYLLYL